MKYAIIILALFAALYFIFVLAPAILFYRIIFRKHWYMDENFEVLNKKNAYYPAFADRFDSAVDYFDKLKKENFEFKTGDGTRLCGILWRAKSDKTAVFLHGYNTPPLNNFCLQAKVLHKQGFSIVFIFARAHAGSGGTSTMGINESKDLIDVLPSIEALTGAKQLLIYGMSMGCTALSYASDRLDSDTVKGLVFDCGFTSPYNQLKQEMIRRHLPVFLIGPPLKLLTEKFLKIDITQSTEEHLKNCKIPALFFHGGADITVPPAEGNKNFKAFSAEKERYLAPGAVHTLCYPAGGEESENLLINFTKKYFK